MQPDSQQSGQGQPVQPGIQPPIAAAPPSPVSTQPQVSGFIPVVDAAAMQQVLAEPAPQAPVQNNVEQFDEIQSDESFEAPVTWVAHEYIHRDKGVLWYVFFVVVILGLIALSIFTKAWSFTALVVVIAFVVIVYTRRPPRELTYSLTDEGLTIDGVLHKFAGFKSFGIIHDGKEFSVMLIPTRRFQPGVSVYFPEEAGEDIVDMLGARLPMKDLKLDVVDRIVRLIKL